LIDLHLHSGASDGSASPEDVVRRAAAVGLSIIAITDHDETEGSARARNAAAAAGVRLVPAIELTARVHPGPEGTVHVLGYGIDFANAKLEEAARANRLKKREQVAAILERLRAEGVPITPEEIGLEPGATRYIGRNQIASALVVRGLAKDRFKAFKRWLAPSGRAYVPVEVVSAESAVAAIRGAGGIAVLAHPTDDDLDRRLAPLVALGVEGIEVYRPRAQGSLLARVEKARAKYGLVATGGSDWHGLYPEVPLGDWKVKAEQIAAFLERLSLKT
jgi:predicted metal-dependent phosphoesterase TrpH